jgi:Na+/glutamate symporter
MLYRFRRAALLRAAAPLIVCAAFVPTAWAGFANTITTASAAARAATADPNDRPTNAVDGALSGAKRGAIAGGIAGGIAGFFGLVKKVSSGRAKKELDNSDREGRPYF